MSSAPLLVFAALLLAAPASAQVAHEASVAVNGRDIAVRYEPQVEKSLRQTGIGPRSSANCTWKTALSVRRAALDAQGRPIAALTRVVDEGSVRRGAQLGLCSTVSARQTAAFGGDEQKLRMHLAQVAARDAAAVRTEVASLNALHPAPALAR